MNRKAFFSHMAGGLSTSVWSVKSRGLSKVQFLFCNVPLTDVPLPLTYEVFLESIKLQ